MKNLSFPRRKKFCGKREKKKKHSLMIVAQLVRSLRLLARGQLLMLLNFRHTLWAKECIEKEEGFLILDVEMKASAKPRGRD